MVSQRALVVWLFLLALAALLLLHRPARRQRPVLVASWTQTPGVVDADITPDNIRTTICVSGWSRSVRPPSDYTSRLKVEQLRGYGLRGPPSAYQEDHLISLELGGNPTDPRNLWPEPYPRASAVDRIENELHHQVCDGSLGLRDAQRRESLLKHTQG